MDSVTQSGDAVPVEEMRRAFRRPDLVIPLVLGRPERLAGSLVDARSAFPLAGLLFGASLLFAVPYGVVLPEGGFWKIPVLYTGAVLICVPSLHVFATYLGFVLPPATTVTLALLLAAVAGIFTFGFFPIVWFIDLTTEVDDLTRISTTVLSVILLAVALFMGIIHVGRVLVRVRTSEWSPGFRWVVAAWLLLFLFIEWRMALVLDLIPR